MINELAWDPVDGSWESPLDPAAVVLLDGAADAILALRAAGRVVVVVSNQPAAAKGKVALETLDAVHARVVELLGPAAGAVAAWRYCRHHPAGVLPELTGACDCRKPAPGLLLDAARDLALDLAASWIAGDSDSDVEAGRAAGCHTILIDNPRSAHRRSGRSVATARAADLRNAVRLLLDAPRGATLTP